MTEKDKKALGTIRHGFDMANELIKIKKGFERDKEIFGFANILTWCAVVVWILGIFSGIRKRWPQLVRLYGVSE